MSFLGTRDGSRGDTGRSFARGVNARLTCSFASRPLRANPVSPRRRRWNAEGAEGARGGGGNREMAETVADTRRLITKPQNLNDAYGPPSNFLEIDVSNPQTVGVGRGRFTTYEIRVKVRPSFSPTVRPLLPSRLAPSKPRSECPQAAHVSRPGAAGCLGWVALAAGAVVGQGSLLVWAGWDGGC